MPLFRFCKINTHMHTCIILNSLFGLVERLHIYLFRRRLRLLIGRRCSCRATCRSDKNDMRRSKIKGRPYLVVVECCYVSYCSALFLRTPGRLNRCVRAFDLTQDEMKSNQQVAATPGSGCGVHIAATYMRDPYQATGESSYIQGRHTGETPYKKAQTSEENRDMQAVRSSRQLST